MQLTARGMVSIPAMGGNRKSKQRFILFGAITPRDGGAIAVIVCNEEGKLVSIPAMGAIAVKILSGVLPVISIPAMGGNSEKELAENLEGNINPRNGGQ